MNTKKSSNFHIDEMVDLANKSARFKQALHMTFDGLGIDKNDQESLIALASTGNNMSDFKEKITHLISNKQSI